MSDEHLAIARVRLGPAVLTYAVAGLLSEAISAAILDAVMVSREMRKHLQRRGW